MKYKSFINFVRNFIIVIFLENNLRWKYFKMYEYFIGNESYKIKILLFIFIFF